MGIQINGNNDIVSALDGSWTAEGASINTTGILTATTFKGNVTGTACTFVDGNFTGNVTIGGTLTYEDVTNVDAVGLVTARSGIRVPDGGRESNEAHIRIGDDGDFRIYHEDGAHTTLENHSSSSDLILMTSSAARDIILKTNGNNERLCITSAGKVLVGDGSAITPVKHFDVRGTGYQGILVGSTNNQGAQLIIDGIGGGDASGGNYSGFDVGTDGHLKIKNYDADKNIILGTGSAIGANDTVVISSDGDVTMTSVDAGALGPTFKMLHNSASPAANDVVSRIGMWGDDSAGNETEYSRIETIIEDPTNGQETAYINFGTRGYSAFNPILRLKNRGTAGSPNYTADDHNGLIIDVHNTGNPYPRYINLIAKSAGNSASNIDFWTEKVGGNPERKLRISDAGKLTVWSDSEPQVDVQATSAAGASMRVQSAGAYAYHMAVSSNFHWRWGMPTGASDYVIRDSTNNRDRFWIDSGNGNYFKGTNHTNLEVRSGDASTKAFIQTVQGSDIRIGSSTDHPVNLYTNSLGRLHLHQDGWCLLHTTTLGNNKNAKELVVQYNNDGVSGGDQGRAGITIRSGQNTSSVSQPGYLYFSDGTAGSNEGIGGITYDHADDDMFFTTGGYQRIRITSGGQLLQTTTHTSGNSAHSNTSWYGDDANQYSIEIRDFNEMYATKTVNTNSYQQIIYKREKMTHNCDIEFMLAGGSDQAGSGYYHLAMTICGDGSDTMSNFDRLVFRSHGGNTGLNEIRVDQAGGGYGFDYISGYIPLFFDGNDRHIQIKIRGRRYSIYSDGAEIVTRYSDADNPRQNGFFGFAIYEASSVNPWIKIRDFKIQNYSLNTSLPSWDVVKNTPASTNNSATYEVTQLNNPRIVEVRFWRLRHSGGDGFNYMQLGAGGSYQTSGYYDIGSYHNESQNSSHVNSRGHNQSHWCPFNWSFNASTNYFSGVITIRRVSSPGRNTRFIYNSEIVVDYDGNSTQYYIDQSGQVSFGGALSWERLKFWNGSSNAYNYGEIEILAQH